MARAEIEIRTVLVTVPDADVGAVIARKLVDARLAACVNVISGIRSVYRWQGVVQDDAEALLIIKTAATRCEALAARINELHPYDVPEILVLAAVGGSVPYLEWVGAETRV